VFRYITFRLSFAERELVIRSGLIFRNERHIPFSRIQNIDAIQNAFHRVLGVVEVRVETGGGQEEEARLSVLPLSALDEIRARVFGGRPESMEHPGHPEHSANPGQPVQLLHLPVKELLLFGFLENKGMVLIGAGLGVLWETGALRMISEGFLGRVPFAQPGFFRDLFRSIFDGGPLPLGRIGILLAAIVLFLLVVRVLSMAWGLVRLYDFRLTRIGEDLRTEYGLLTKVAATVPIRRVQAISIRVGLLHRWLNRSSVRVATAGGTGGSGGDQQQANLREWLAPIIRDDDLPRLLGELLPGFDFSAVTWQPVHPRAFRRAMKPILLVFTVIAMGSAPVINIFSALALLTVLAWLLFTARKQVQHLGWAETDEVVLARTGWLWRNITLVRVNKIQAVAMHQSPFDRRATMARLRVDTAGAGEFSHRVDVPYLDHVLARGLADRLSAAAASTAFRW